MNVIDTEPEDVPRPRRARVERERAVRYLDLWERHVGLTALNGTEPWTTADTRPLWRGSGV